ncbi:type IV toxin-antitoxin system AbiEi family antitoxin domain-containing protein [Brooklawnia cerclae]|uniref:Transcriptional regulator of viral defense system n=1 Tax=Brooklawnia cerclae TaxID=349934 RepID=A0ABX0SHZ9_9ACTN|nr:type IV toxin-antitoxin system AbiEi family antitoxin domain-containing protein [Brooklawnia cerclae]NIH57586.1 putative transcriptional regulator of viral defense system [Brooklawnia cerclae]
MNQGRQAPRRLLEATAFKQSGYFTAAQAKEVGYTYQAQKYHVDAGNWVRVDRGLFRLPSWPSDLDDQYVVWTLWSRGLGVVSHESALRVHGLSDVDPAQVHLSVPPGFKAKDAMVMTHHQVVPPEDTEQRRAWTVTSPLRTLADVSAGNLSQEHIDQAVADAMERGMVTRRSILRRTAELPERAALRLERALTAMEHHGDI